jgi:hypothetical protein
MPKLNDLPPGITSAHIEERQKDAPERWGKEPPKDERFDSVVGAFDEVERLIGWLGYVQENEYTADERNRIIAVAKAFANTLQPIASKYLD